MGEKGGGSNKTLMIKLHCKVSQDYKDYIVSLILKILL